MFKTIYTVQMIQGVSSVYHAYFEDFKDAKKFAEKEVSSIDDDFIFGKRSHPDGSFEHFWTGDHNEVLLNNFAWVTDFHFFGGVRFYDSQGLVETFKNYSEFKNYLSRSQKIAQS